MGHNSTIRVNKKWLKCGHFDYNFSKGRCAQCAKVDSFNKREEKDKVETEDLSGLIEDADALFSRWIRLKYSDNRGLVKCYTCPTLTEIGRIQCGHYMSRKSYLLRWDERNCRAQCVNCNCNKHGNVIEFSKRLEIENPGITEILLEESRIIYKPSREELRAIISELTGKLKKFK